MKRQQQQENNNLMILFYSYIRVRNIFIAKINYAINIHNNVVICENLHE